MRGLRCQVKSRALQLKSSVQRSISVEPIHRGLMLHPMNSVLWQQCLGVRENCSGMTRFDGFHPRTSGKLSSSMEDCKGRVGAELSTGQMDPRVGSGRVGSRFCRILAGRVESGQLFGFSSFLLIISWYPYYPIDIINNRLDIEGLDSQILCSRITRLLAWKEKDLVTGTNNIKKSCACASFFSASCTLYITERIFGLWLFTKCKSSVRNLKIEIIK